VSFELSFINMEVSLQEQNINEINDYSQKERMVNTYLFHSRWLNTTVLSEIILSSLPHTPIHSKWIRFRKVQTGSWPHTTNYNHDFSMINSNMLYLIASKGVYQ